MEPDIRKEGKITEVVQSDQQILIQIAKEPISTKGPRITSEISIAGRYIVLIPFAEKVSVSQKIRSQEERERLKRLINSIKPKNFGVIIRTVAEGKGVAELDADMNDLVGKWNLCFQELTKAKPPARVLEKLIAPPPYFAIYSTPHSKPFILMMEECLTRQKNICRPLRPTKKNSKVSQRTATNF